MSANKLRGITLALALLMTSQMFAQRVLGYLPSYRDPSPASIQYDKITDVVFSFINPNTNGTLNLTTAGAPLWNWDATRFLICKNEANSNGVNLWVALAGADDAEQRSDRMASVCANSTFRTNLVNDLVNLAVTENLYGLAIDWEFPKTTTRKNNHETFLQELRAALDVSANPSCKIACAVGGEATGGINHTQYINNNAFNYIDEIHLMTYDFPASYDIHHSTLSDAQTSLVGWALAHSNFDVNKTLLGVPFYGRDAGRTNELEYNNFSGSAATNFNNDVVNHFGTNYYYNGCPTLESKFDHIINEGGLGVLIWDLGQDRTDQYSLLTCLDDHAGVICPIPQPDLGPNQGFCAPGNILLDPGVPTAGGRTFTWRHNGTPVVSGSSTQNTYNITQGGDWEVEVFQGACSKSDIITIIEGTPITTTNDTRCGPGVVNLSVTTPGGPYDWYDAPIGGTVVNTGSAYAPNLSATDTFYVQDGSTSTTYNTGKAVMPASNWLPDANRLYGQLLTVSTDLTLESIRVWPSATADIDINIVSVLDGQTVLQSAGPFNVTSAGSLLSLNFVLTPGQYFICAQQNSGNNTNLLVDPASTTDFDIPGVVTVSGAEYGDWGAGFSLGGGPTTNYGQLFDFQISTGVVSPCGREMSIGTIDPLSPMPGAFTASEDSICQGSTGTVFTVPNAAGTFAWNYTGTGETINGSGNSITLDFNASATSGDLEVTFDNGSGCGPSAPRTISIYADPCVSPPTSDFTTSSNAICVGESVTFTDASSGSITNYSWNFGAGATPPTANTAGPHVVTYSTTGAKNVSLDVTGPGGNDLNTKNGFVTVLAAPTTSNAGPDQNLCATSATLAANTVGGGETGTWTLVSGTGTITSANDPNSTVTGLGVGTNTFRWSIDNGVCTPSTDEVDIVRTSGVTAAAAGPDQSLCASSATLAGNTPGGGETGTWSVVSGSGTFTNANDPGTTVNGLGVGANVFRWTISNGSCPDETDDVTITREEDPTASNAGTDQNVCATSANLAGNTPTVGTGTWTVVSGTGTFGNANDPNSIVNGLSAGANVFRWTISNGSCVPSTDEVTITQSGSLTSANAGPDQAICVDNTTLAANAAGGGETGTWTVISGAGTFTNANDEGTTVTGLGTGVNTFRWTIDNGVCTPSFDEVDITREQDPTTSNAGPDQNICGSTATLAGNTPAVGTGMWTVTAGSASITNASDPATDITITAGPVTLEWTISNGSCTPSVDAVTITQSGSVTTSNAGPDQNVCATTATLAGNPPGGGETGTWTLVSGSGSITSPNDPASGVSGLGVGTNTFEWSIDNGICTPSTDQVDIIVDENPTASAAGPDQNICGAVATMAANTPSVGTGTWTLISGTATIDSPNDPASTISGISGPTTVLEWSISNGTCPPSTDQITITQTGTVTTANAGPDQNVCGTSATLAGNTVGGGETGTWTVVSGSGTFTNANDPSTGVSGLGMGANVFQWSIDNGVCPPSTDQVTITQDVPPTTADAGPDQQVCGGSATLAGNTPSSGTGTWTIVSGTGSITSPNDPASGVTGITATTTLQWTITNGCGSTNDQVAITEDCSLNADFTASLTTACMNTTIVFTDATTGASGSATYAWDFGADAVPPTAVGIGPHNVQYTSTGSKDVSLTVTDGGNSVENKVGYITVTSAPVTSAITGPEYVPCNGMGGNYSVINTPGSIYNWNVPAGATLVSGQGTNAIVVDFGTQSGTISVAEIAGGCVGTAVLLYINVCAVGVEDETKVELDIHPNPFSDRFNITINDPSGDEYRLVVTDLHGKVVIEKDVITSDMEVTVGENLAQGVYIGRLISDSRMLTFKVVKHD